MVSAPLIAVDQSELAATRRISRLVQPPVEPAQLETAFTLGRRYHYSY